MQDALVALQSGLPAVIKHETYNVPAAEPIDFAFDIFSIPPPDTNLMILNTTQRREMALIFVEKVKLCEALHLDQTSPCSTRFKNPAYMPELLAAPSL
jgi:hypothetical protein